MGCGGSKTAEEVDESSHKLATAGAFDKDATVDFSNNPNTYISNCEKYYKKSKSRRWRIR